MTEIAALPKNGFKAASTFSGCGGSSLGYKMAGFDVVWASEFIPAAQETYRANHPSTILDDRDVRKVDPKDVLEAMKMKAGQLDLLDGSPPCAAFSTAGKREAGWGVEKKYSDSKQRVDDLFFEYARILRGVQPKCFVAENVAGLVKGSAKGYFKMILKELRACGYRVEARVLDAQWLGVPQQRNRLIFVGVREDLEIDPAFPSPLPYRYSIREACPWIGSGAGEVRDEALVIGDPDWKKAEGAGWSRGERRNLDEPAPTVQAAAAVMGGSPAHLEFTSGYNSTEQYSVDEPSPVIMAGGIGGSSFSQHVLHVLAEGKRKFTIAELRRICSFPDDFILTGSYAQQWERLGRAVPPVMMSHVAAAVRDRILKRCVG